MLKKLSTLLMVFAVLTAASFAQDMKSVQSPKVAITGAELGNQGTIGNSTTPESVHFPPVVAGDLTFTFVNTAVFTGYDLQSNGTSQHIWQDPTDPNLVHMVFTKSAQTSSWSDRNGVYLFSDDMGATWQNLGIIQTGTAASRGGFVTINGLDDGRPVAALHTNDETTPATRTQVYVRNAAGDAWTRYNPGPAADGEGIWPRVLGVHSDHVVVTSSINGAPNNDFLTNTLDLTSGTFSGWNSITGDQAETQNVARSTDQQTIGLAYVGNGADSVTFGGMFYRESNDGGVSWSDPVQIWTYDYAGDSLGAMRGMDICFLGNDPYVVFEVIKQDFSAASYFPSFPNKVFIWSPALNGGTAVMLADSNNIPYFDNYNAANDVQGPIGRPSIGKTSDDNGLFVTINATTADTMMAPPPSTDANTFYAGYFMYSTDKGTTWTAPQKITPDRPKRDWKYFSLNPVTPVDGTTGLADVMMAAQSDSIPGSTVNATAGYPVGVTAELVFISTEVQMPTGVNDNQLVHSFNLDQNYPNPFNPTTSIKFSVPERSNVSLKVYDILGKEVATLVNETKEAGSYNLTFNSSSLASGVYLYTLKAGSFTSTKKMILMK